MNKELIDKVVELMPEVRYFEGGAEIGSTVHEEVIDIINLCQQDFLKRAFEVVDNTFSDYVWRKEVAKALKAEFEK